MNKRKIYHRQMRKFGRVMIKTKRASVSYAAAVSDLVDAFRQCAETVRDASKRLKGQEVGE